MLENGTPGAMAKLFADRIASRKTSTSSALSDWQWRENWITVDTVQHGLLNSIFVEDCVCNLQCPMFPWVKARQLDLA
jgi:hypothetical protein